MEVWAKILGLHGVIFPKPCSKFIQVSCASSANGVKCACAGEIELCVFMYCIW